MSMSMNKPIDGLFRYLRARMVRPHISRGSVVLDIGCGPHAQLLRDIATHIKEGIGIDMRVANEHYENIETRTARAGDVLPFLDASLDAVLTLAVLEHLDDPRMVVKEVYRVLRRGGKFIVTVPTWVGKPFLELLAFWLHIIDEDAIRDHKRYYNKKELQGLLVSAGFLEDHMTARYFEFGCNLFCVVEKEFAPLKSNTSEHTYENSCSIKKITILVPVFNEEKTVEECIRQIHAADVCGLEKEIVVVDDASSDLTREKLNRIGGIILIRHAHNFGKGAAVKSGLERVSGDIVLIQDGDLEYDPGFYPQLIRPITEGIAGVVYGSRFMNVPPEFKNWHYYGNRLLTLISNVVLGTLLTDEATCYKVMKTATMKGLDLQSNGFDIDIEITAKLARRGYQIHEIPVSYNRRTRKEGKKIRLFYDGAKTLLKLVRFYYWD